MSWCSISRGDFVLVGDLMKSLSLLMYNKQQGGTGTGQLEARARDYDSKWMTAIEVLDDDTYIAADNSHNLVGTAHAGLPGSSHHVHTMLLSFVGAHAMLVVFA